MIKIKFFSFITKNKILNKKAGLPAFFCYNKFGMKIRRDLIFLKKFLSCFLLSGVLLTTGLAFANAGESHGNSKPCSMVSTDKANKQDCDMAKTDSKPCCHDKNNCSETDTFSEGFQEKM